MSGFKIKGRLSRLVTDCLRKLKLGFLRYKFFGVHSLVTVWVISHEDI